MKNLLLTFGLFSLMLVLTSFKGISTENTLEEMNYSIVSIDNDHRGGQVITPGKKDDADIPGNTGGYYDHRGGQVITPGKKDDADIPGNTGGYYEHRGGQVITPGKKDDADIPGNK